MSSHEAPAPVREGDVIAAKYRVERVLGAGGMGVVVLATHIDLGQQVAIKFLLAEAAHDGELIERFLREGRASVRLRGQHVVKTLDVGRLDDGAPYLVMEFLRGQALRDIVQQHPNGLPLETMCSFLLQACEGIAEAHALGIVHRDLKPENLFVTHGIDGWPLLKVLDFGISKVADEGFAGSLTRTNTLFGSPMYMSPEQMRSAKHVDSRADIWSLGIIAYELATGHAPFQSETMYDLCLRVAQDTPAPLAAIRPELPAALIRGIEQCLSKDVGGRLQNVAELAAILEPFAGPRARGTAQRLGDVIRASGAAFASLASPAPSSPNNVQSAWGATERATKPPSKPRGLIAYVAAALAAGVVAVVLVQQRGPAATTPLAAAEPPPQSVATEPSSVPVPTTAALVPPTSSALAAPAASAPTVSAVASTSVSGHGKRSVVPGAGSAPIAAAAVVTPAVSPAPAPPPPTPPPPADGFVNNR